MKKDFIVSKIETSQDGNPFVYIASTDPHNPKSAGGDENSCFPSSSSVIVMKRYQKWRRNKRSTFEGLNVRVLLFTYCLFLSY